MNARAILYREDGALRAPWRLLGFAIVSIATMWTLQFVVSLVRPLPDVSPTDLRVILLTFTLLAISLLVAHAVMLRLVDRRPWSSVGLGSEHVEPKPLARASSIGVLAIGVPSLVLVVIGWLRVESQPGGTPEWLVFAISTLAFLTPAALFEELLFRGYPFAVLRETFGWKPTVLVTSVLFGFLHFDNPGAGPLPLLVVALAGVWLAMVLLATGSLVAAWLAHLAWNWTLLALLHAPVSGLRLPPPGYRLADAGPEWATGGIWGPEGGVFAALGLLAATWYLFRLWQHRQVSAQ